jgi:phosphatidylglycerol---prolipoprotein diacylglyceryl transferase
MLPYIVKIGPLTLYSYGLMLATGFLVGAWLMRIELRRWGYDERISDHVAIAAMVGGVLGAKVWHMLIDEPGRLFSDPVGAIFSGSGLTFYGGLILGMGLIYLVARHHRMPFLRMLDMLGPIGVMGYGFGRCGCFLSGDGDYGIPTNLHHNGIYDPPMISLPGGGFEVPNDLPWTMSFPNGTVPSTIPVHPTPLYEIAIMWAAFAVLWFVIRRKPLPRGMMIAISLIVMGVERLFTEIWRVSASLLYGFRTDLGYTTQAELDAFSRAVKAHYGLLGLSNAQWTSVGMIVFAVLLIIVIWKRPKVTPESESAGESG